MIKFKYSKRLGLLVFCLAFTLTMCGAAAAAVPTNTTHNNISNNVNQATASLNTTTNSINRSQPKNDTVADPQIYRNGVAVARGGHAAGYVFPTILGAINAALSGDTIMLANGATFYTTGFTIKKNLNFNVFNNGKATLENVGNLPVFNIASGVIVLMQNLIMINGKYANGGAIFNDGTLTVKNCTFIDDAATGNSGGGAIFNDGSSTLTVNNCTFKDNTVPGGNGGGAIYNAGKATVTGSTFNASNSYVGCGGAIYNIGKMTVNGSTFTDNTANVDGGAIYNHAGTLNVANCIFTGNSAPVNFGSGEGGAIFSNLGNLNVNNCIFTNNNAAYSGGAIFSSMSLNVTNSTFINNNAYYGGAIYGSKMTITDSSLTDNKAFDGGALYIDGNSNIHFNQIFGNTGSSSGNDIYISAGASVLTFNWWGYNLVTNIAKQIYNHGGTVTYNPWIILTITASPTSVQFGGTSKITVNLWYDSNGVYHSPSYGVVPYTGYASFKTNKGKIVNVKFVNGKATSTLTNLSTKGVAAVSATVDNLIVTTKVTVKP